MSGPLGAVPPPNWLAAQLAVAPWLFWICPPCWVLALLSPIGCGGPCEGSGRASEA